MGKRTVSLKKYNKGQQIDMASASICSVQGTLVETDPLKKQMAITVCAKLLQCGFMEDEVHFLLERSAYNRLKRDAIPCI